MGTTDPTVLDIYAVAAAILIDATVPHELWELTKEIQASRLTRLGNSGKTPERTVAGQLSINREYFTKPYRGAYEIRSKEYALTSPKITYAYTKYLAWKESKELRAVNEQQRMELKQLRIENKRLKKVILQISDAVKHVAE